MDPEEGFLCGQRQILHSYTWIFVTFELRSKACIYKLLLQIITEKFGAESWAQDGFYYKHTSSVPIKHSLSLYVVSPAVRHKKGLQKSH